MIGLEPWAIIGFLFAAYAVVGNDALQTLGTFINSNKNLHWGVLFAFAGAILVVTFTLGWLLNDGDPSYGRLDDTAKYPPIAIQWYHTIPPAVLLIITRLGIPVSTSFLVLTIFATGGGLESMIQKSLLGYAIAFGIGLGLYLLITRTVERWIDRTPLNRTVPYGLLGGVGAAFFLSQYFVFGTMDSAVRLLIALGAVALLEGIGIFTALKMNRAYYWVTLQWASTAYLWSVWLMQDFANIFVFLPRELTATQSFGAMGAILVLLAITFANRGGPVQRILRKKTRVDDIRSATIVDFTYACLLFFFKELNNIPMSTTWVFLGLIAGREYGFALMRSATGLARAAIDTAEDVAKAYLGLVISVDLAVGLPMIAEVLANSDVSFADVVPGTAFRIFVLVANVTAIPLTFFAFSRPEDRFAQKDLAKALVAIVTLLVLAALIFVFPIGV